MMTTRKSVEITMAMMRSLICATREVNDISEPGERENKTRMLAKVQEMLLLKKGKWV